jgi:hypothetical protein
MKHVRVRVIRTGFILNMKIIADIPGFYKVQFENEVPKWYRKGLFYGKNKVYEFLD